MEFSILWSNQIRSQLNFITLCMFHHFQYVATWLVSSYIDQHMVIDAAQCCLLESMGVSGLITYSHPDNLTEVDEDSCVKKCWSLTIVGTCSRGRLRKTSGMRSHASKVAEFLSSIEPHESKVAEFLLSSGPYRGNDQDFWYYVGLEKIHQAVQNWQILVPCKWYLRQCHIKAPITPFEWLALGRT